MKLCYQAKEALEVLSRLREREFCYCCHSVGVRFTAPITNTMTCEHETGIYCCNPKLPQEEGQVVFSADLEEQFEFIVELVQTWSVAKEVVDFPDHLEVGEVVENCSKLVG